MSLPFADIELDLTEATNLIRLEAGKQNSPDSELDAFVAPILLNALDFTRYKLETPAESGDWEGAISNAYSQLEAQTDRYENLELLAKFGPNQWRIHNYNTELQIALIKTKKQEVLQSIKKVNLSRQKDQYHVQKKLSSLNEKSKETVTNIKMIREAVADLKRQIQQVI